LWEGSAEFPCDSATQRAKISKLVAEWKSHIHDPLEEFSKFLEQDGRVPRKPQ
jgi:hypothetical protein